MADIRTPFMDALVLMIQRGEKWNTRRILTPKLGKFVRPCIDWQERAFADPLGYIHVPTYWVDKDGATTDEGTWDRVRCRAAAGDTMLVGEALVPTTVGVNTGPADPSDGERLISYRADGFIPWGGEPWPWKVNVLPAIYCPIGCVRHRRTLLTVHPERLSEITDEGAIAEGIAALGWEPTRAGFLTGFRALHGLAEGDDPWVEVRAWKRGEVSDG